MPDWPPELRWPGPLGVLSTAGAGSQHAEAVANQAQSFSAAAAWPTANLALFAPVTVTTRITIYQLGWINGGTASGNIDAGVYDANGVLLISTGSTAQGTISVPQFVDVTDTVVQPGTVYMALAADNTTATVNKGGNAAQLARASGMAQMAAAFPLPATATFAAMAQTFGCPLVVAPITGAVI